MKFRPVMTCKACDLVVEYVFGRIDTARQLPLGRSWVSVMGFLG